MCKLRPGRHFFARDWATRFNVFYERAKNEDHVSIDQSINHFGNRVGGAILRRKDAPRKRAGLFPNLIFRTVKGSQKKQTLCRSKER